MVRHTLVIIHSVVLRHGRATPRAPPPRKSRLAMNDGAEACPTLHDEATSRIPLTCYVRPSRPRRPGGRPRRRGALRTSGRGRLNISMAGARRAGVARSSKGRGRRRSKRPRVEGFLEDFWVASMNGDACYCYRRGPASGGRRTRETAPRRSSRRRGGRSDRSERDFYVARCDGDVRRR